MILTLVNTERTSAGYHGPVRVRRRQSFFALGPSWLFIRSRTCENHSQRNFCERKRRCLKRTFFHWCTWKISSNKDLLASATKQSSNFTRIVRVKHITQGRGVITNNGYQKETTMNFRKMKACITILLASGNPGNIQLHGENQFYFISLNY